MLPEQQRAGLGERPLLSGGKSLSFVEEQNSPAVNAGGRHENPTSRRCSQQRKACGRAVGCPTTHVVSASC